MNKVIRPIFLSMLFCCTLFVSVEPALAKKTKIEWKQSRGIGRYDIQVRNKLNSEIKEYSSSGDHVWVDVDFGIYEMKISAYDTKGRLVAETAWTLMTVMRTYQPSLDKVEISKQDRSLVTLHGESFFDKTNVSVRRAEGELASNIESMEPPSKIVVKIALDPNGKYYIDILNPGDYSVKRIAHVFEDDSVMLFETEHQYFRYFARFFVEASAAYEIIHSDYDFKKDAASNYWKDTYSEGLTSFTLLSGYHLVPWFGLCGGLEYRRYENSRNVSGDIEVVSNYLVPQLGMFFSYKHKNFVPYISAGIGPALSYLTVEGADSNFEYDSTDLYYSYGLGFKYFFFRQYYALIDIRNSRIDLQSQALDTLGFRLGFGAYIF